MLLQSISDVSSLAFFVVDNRTDDILYFNHRFCEIWGIEHLEERMQRGELKNNDIIPDCTSFQNLTVWQCEYRVQFADRRIIWVSGHATPQREPDGSILWHGYTQEITQRKQAEIALKESEVQLRDAYAEQNAIFAALTDIVLIRNSEGKCLKIVSTHFNNVLENYEEILQ